MLEKHSFDILAGPGGRAKITLKQQIVIPLGIKQGHIDVFIAKKLPFKKADYKIDVHGINQIAYIRILKKIYMIYPKWISKFFKKLYYWILLGIAKLH